MIEDIYAYFPLNTIGEKSGYFVNFVPSYIGLGKHGNGRKYSMWGNYNWCIGSNDEGTKVTFLNMFHGHCLPYAYYFKERNIDWKLGFLMYDSIISERYKHVFCYKETDDGRILFADARGTTDNVCEFFEDFSFSKNTMHVYTNCIGNPDRYATLLEDARDGYNELDDGTKKSIEKAYVRAYEKLIT